jgi:hypothetical protein
MLWCECMQQGFLFFQFFFFDIGGLPESRGLRHTVKPAMWWLSLDGLLLCFVSVPGGCVCVCVCWAVVGFTVGRRGGRLLKLQGL